MDRTLSLLVKIAALDKLTAPMRAMSGSAKKTGRDLASTRKEVLQLERSAAKIGGLRDLREELTGTHQQLDVARRRVAALRAAIKQADGPTGRLARQLEAAENKVTRLGTQSEKQASHIAKLGSELRDAGVDVTRLADHEAKLGRSLGDANRRLAEQTAQLQRNERASQRAQNMQASGQRMSAAGAGLLISGVALGAPMVIAVQQAAEFRSSMTDIALKTGMSAEAATAMGRRIEALAPKVSQLPEALQAGIDLLAGKGMSAAAAEGLIGPIGMAASAAKADLKDLSEAGYAAYGNLEVSMKDIPAALDAMYVAGKKGAVELKDMAKFMPALGAAAAALGQEGVRGVADLAAALQIAEKGTGNAEQAANNIANLLQKMNAPDTVKNFEKMGVDLPRALKKAYKDGKTPLEAIAELTQKALKGDMSKLGYLFGDAQAQGGVRTLIQNLDEYRKIRASAEAGGGELQQDYSRRDAGGEFVNPKYEAQLSRFKNLAGDILLPTINTMIEKLGVFVGKLNQWADANPALASGILHAVAAVAGLGVALGALGTIFGPIVGGFGKLISAVSWLKNVGWIARLGTFIMSWARAIPVMRLLGSTFGWIARGVMIAASAIAAFVGIPVWVVGAIAAAIALAGYLIYQNWDKVSAFLSNIWGQIKDAWKTGLVGLVVLAVTWFGQLWGLATRAILGLGPVIARYAPMIGTWLLNSLVALPMILVRAFAAGTSGLVAAMPGIWSRVWPALKFIVWNGLALLPRLAVELGVNTVKGLISGISSMYGALRSKMMGLGKSAVGWFKNVLGIKSPSRVFMGLGGHMMGGLAIGLDRAASRPMSSVRAVARGLATAAAGTLTLQPVTAQAGVSSAPVIRAGTGGLGGPGASGGRGMSFGEVHIHIHAGPGQDAKSIASEVRRQLEEVDRSRASAARASYEDRD